MRFFTILFLFSFFTIGVFAQTATPTPTPTIKENVTVSTGTSQPLEDVSKTVNVIDSKELKERSEFSLTDTLRTLPGFRVQQVGGFGRLTTIKTRGLRNQDTAVLLDGIRFRDAAAINGDASSFIGDFTNTNAFRIEVLRGSGSSLYGTNAVGGAVDIQTQEPKKGFHGGISGNFGGLGFQRYRGNISDGFDKFGYSIGVSRTIFSKGIDKDDASYNTNFNGRIDYKPSYKTFLSGRIYVSDASVKLNSSPDTFGTLPALSSTIINANRGVNFVVDANDPDALQNSNAFNGQLHFTQIFNDKFVFNATYQGLKTRRKNSNGILGVGFQSPSTSFFDGQIHTLNNRVNWTANDWNLFTVGYEYELEKYGNRGFETSVTSNFNTTVKQTSNTFYAQNQMNFLNRKLQFSLAARGQFFKLNRPTFSGNNPLYKTFTLSSPPNAYTFDGSVAYFVEKTGTKFRGHAGNGYRVPSLYERFGTFYDSFELTFVALGDPELTAERSLAFDAGVDQSFAGNRVNLSATYFYTRLQNTIDFGSPARQIGTTTRPYGGYRNSKGGLARGLELSAEIRPFETTSIFTSYTYTNSDQRQPQVSGSKIIETLGIPKKQFSLIATQYIGKNFFVNFDFAASSKYLAPIFSNTTFSSYVYSFNGNRKADLTASYEFATKKDKLKIRLYGTLENLFNYEYFENGFQTAGRFGRVGLGLTF
jgi:vitamin B12 transporter